jgi:iron complex outermembrane recepter protein
MFSRSKMNLAVIAALSATAIPALAQTPERIEVTGTRILSLGAQANSPLQVLSAEDISKSGVTNIQDLILKIPAMGTPGISRTNSNFSTSSAGVATVDLRNLGSDRTLVLVNGRRYVAGIPGSATVDLNTIPTDFIERVEVLTGGSSATYGSDAIAGVVNIILKKNFQGVTLDASVGRAEKGDDKLKKASISFGSNLPNGKGNVMAHAAFSDQGAVFSKDRPDVGGARDSISRGAGVTGDPADIFTLQEPFFSSFAPQGRFFPNSNATGTFTFDSSGNIVPFSTNGPAGDGVGATGFNRQEFRTIAIPTKRLLLSTKADYSYLDDHSVFLEGTYAATNTRTRLEPFPLDSVQIYPVLGASRGRAPAEALVNGTVVRNPLISDAIYARLRDTDGDGLRDYAFTRRLSEVGNRGNVADRGTVRFATGLKGTLFSNWDYDVVASYGRTTESQVSSGQVNVLNFRNALDAVPDTNDVNGNGNRTEGICRDANARAQGCVPINVFGFNSVSPAALAYVQAPGSLATFASQKIVSGSVSGEAFNLPAGPLGVAFGAEYRKESSRTEFDALQQAGLNAGNAIPRTEGSFDVTEVFAEAKIPLLKDLPGVKSLAATLAVRGGDYSTVGKINSYNAGLEWTVIPDVRFRAMQAVSTRAPNVGELFQPPSQTFPTGIIDPCNAVTQVSTTAASVRCRADAGVAANIAANISAANPNGRFTLSQSDTQGISGFNIGNPSLKQEKGTSTTFGFVIAPTSIPALKNTSFTLDYFKIKVDDAIQAPGRNFILNQCYTLDASFCRFVTRRAQAAGANSAGSIQFINAVQANSGGSGTEGFDLTASYADKVGEGRLRTKFSYTYVKSLYSIAAPGADVDQSAGEVGAAKNKFTLDMGYSIAGFGANATIRYIDKSALDDQFLAQFTDANNVTLQAGALKVPAKTYTDLQFTYTYSKVTFRLGIDNAFGTKAPLIPSAVTGNVTGTNTASDVYDAIGRRYYLGVRVEL